MGQVPVIVPLRQSWPLPFPHIALLGSLIGRQMLDDLLPGRDLLLILSCQLSRFA